MAEFSVLYAIDGVTTVRRRINNVRMAAMAPYANAGICRRRARGHA